MSVVVIGDALIDELRDDGRVGVREFVGGAALNVAVGLTRLGVPATLIAMVGDDEAGDHIRAYLRDYGVTLLASPGPRGSSRAVSLRGAGGEPTYVFNDAARARAVRFGDAERAAIAEADLVVVSCFPFDDADQAAALAEVVDGTPVAVDPNPRTGMMRDRAAFVRGFEALAARAVLVKVGEDDAAVLYGDTLDALRARMAELGVPAVVATAGAAGAAVVADGTVVSVPVATVPGRIVDTMGAGDAVLSSIVSSLLDGTTAVTGGWAVALERAMAVAAATCRFEGALLRLPSALAGDGRHLDRIGT